MPIAAASCVAPQYVGEAKDEPEYVGDVKDKVVSYQGGTFSSSIERQIRNPFNEQKVFELGRVQPGTSVTATLKRQLGGTGSITFDVQFSPTGSASSWATPMVASGQCGMNIGEMDSVQKTCVRTATASYARILVTAVYSTDASFVLGETHTPVENVTQHSHYGTDIVKVNNFDGNGNDPDRCFVRIAGTKEVPTYAGALQFQRVAVKVVRSGPAVTIDRLNGLKLKDTASENSEIADFDCPTNSNGNDLWTNNVITCVMAVVPRDGDIHIPLSRPDASTATATVTITRTSPNTSGTASVRTELTATTTMN